MITPAFIIIMALDRDTQNIVIVNPAAFGCTMVPGAPVENDFRDQQTYKRCLKAWQAYVSALTGDVTLVNARVVTRVYKTDRPMEISSLPIKSLIGEPTACDKHNVVDEKVIGKTDPTISAAPVTAKSEKVSVNRVGGFFATYALLSEQVGDYSARTDADYAIVRAMVVFLETVVKSKYHLSRKAVSSCYTALQHDDSKVKQLLQTFPLLQSTCFSSRLQCIQATHRKNLLRFDAKRRTAKRLAVEDIRLETALTESLSRYDVARNGSDRLERLEKRFEQLLDKTEKLVGAAQEPVQRKAPVKAANMNVVKNADMLRSLLSEVNAGTLTRQQASVLCDRLALPSFTSYEANVRYR